MGKKIKFKEYTPRDGDKYVVVVDPWGRSGRHPTDLSNVGAWFELMLREEYPGTKALTIYTQGTHDNVIVKLPSNVDLNKILGAHRWGRILKPPYTGNEMEGTSWIYEYNYGSYNDPARTNWKSNFPEYSIGSGFPIKYPYPEPELGSSPPSDVTWAKQLPDHLRLAEDQILPALSHLGPNDEPTEEQTAGHSQLPSEAPNVDFNPPEEEQKFLTSTKEEEKPSIPMYERDSRSTTRLESAESSEPVIKADSPGPMFKRDPYEEDHDAVHLLRDVPQLSGSTSRVKTEPREDDIEPEIRVKAGRVPNKMSIDPLPSNGDYTPSDELVHLFGTYPENIFGTPMVSNTPGPSRSQTAQSPEDIKPDIKPDIRNETSIDPPGPPKDNYEPCEELKRLFGTLPGNIISSHPSLSAFTMTPNTPGPSRSQTATSSGDTPIRVKPEPEEPDIKLLASVSPSMTRTRDPRRRTAQTSGNSTTQNKRAWEGSSRENNQPKRIKPEPDW
ncbi:hypothetical protein BDN72DRAFT_274814 [Pluteus cervinus]|uniref:Uncharacterized protein n=1 Tax=Pluteus cervinus TaxID=181527 RepID=A0ACD3AEX0_9AGAR|nr:hypothetical protein BDN72DRAFT_274814 [Pluteus cervinus]